MAVTECNPSHHLAYRRFCSQATLDFVSEQCDILRQYTPNIPITHNFIPLADTQFDYFAVAQQLDFASYDSYPLGRSDLFFSDQENANFLRTGHPDLNSFYLAQTRSLCDKSFWVMEQQPGPVNWAKNNPRPLPGMIRLWTFEAFAQGASCVSYFRWRQAAFAQEQMHAGLLRVDDSESEAFREIEQCLKELENLSMSHEKELAKIAIVMDVSNQWISEIEKQGSGYCYDKVLFDYYTSLRQLGLDCDFIGPEGDFSSYQLIIVPCQMIVDEAFVENCKKTKATILFGPRTGSKTAEFQLEPNLAPGPLQQLLPIKVLATETLPNNYQGACQWQGDTFQGHLWREQIEASQVEVLCRNEFDEAVLVESGQFVYLASLMGQSFIKETIQHYCRRLGIECLDLPPSLRIAKRGGYSFAFNYSTDTLEAPLRENDTLVIGKKEIAPQSLAVWKTNN